MKYSNIEWYTRKDNCPILINKDQLDFRLETDVIPIEKESKDVIVTIVNNKFTKVEVSSKKQFNSAKDKHGKLYVYEEGLYKSVKKYESGEEYYSKEKQSLNGVVGIKIKIL